MTVSLDGDDHRVHGTQILCRARLEGRLVAVPYPILSDACYRFEGSQASSGGRSRTLRHPSLSDTCNYMKISSSFLDPSFILSGHTGEVVIVGDQWSVVSTILPLSSAIHNYKSPGAGNSFPFGGVVALEV
jgi:hypothetical protein